MRKAIMAGTFLLAVAGCGRGGGDNAANGAGPSGNDVASTQTNLSALAPGERDGVFIRAIRDAGQNCQHVDSSSPGPTVQGYPTWTARCQGGAQYQIAVTANGTAQVTPLGGGAPAGNSQ